MAVHTTNILGKVVHLIDTPGFDDSGRSDGEALEELAYWLATAYEHDIQLSGIIYLHRITDVRLQGSSWRALQGLQSMCGNHNLDGVIIATTMWDAVAPQQVQRAFERHEMLRDKIRRDMAGDGGRIVALTTGESAAIETVKHIVRRDQRMILDFQWQLVDEERVLGATDVGKTLFGIKQRSSPDLHKMLDDTETSLVKNIERKRAGTGYLNVLGDGVFSDTQQRCEKTRRLNQRLSALRCEWEEKLGAERRILEEALRKNEQIFEARSKALEDLYEQDQQILPLNSLSTAEKSLTKELDDLRRFREVIQVRESRRLDRRFVDDGSSSKRLGLLGAGLAAGQLVATMIACNVM